MGDDESYFALSLPQLRRVYLLPPVFSLNDVHHVPTLFDHQPRLLQQRGVLLLSAHAALMHVSLFLSMYVFVHVANKKTPLLVLVCRFILNDLSETLSPLVRPFYPQTTLLQPFPHSYFTLEPSLSTTSVRLSVAARLLIERCPFRRRSTSPNPVRSSASRLLQQRVVLLLSAHAELTIYICKLISIYIHVFVHVANQKTPFLVFVCPFYPQTTSLQPISHSYFTLEPSPSTTSVRLSVAARLLIERCPFRRRSTSPNPVRSSASRLLQQRAVKLLSAHVVLAMYM